MCRLAALIMLAGLCFANTAQAQDIPLETVPSRGERLLWIEPVGTTFGFIATSGKSPGDVYSDEQLYVLSGGYAHPLDAHRALATELFVLRFAGLCHGSEDVCHSTTAVRASAGLAYSFGGSPGRGFLLQPRLILGYYNETSSTGFPVEVAHGFSLQAGLDVGYQWRFGPLYLAVVGGLAAGVGIGSELAGMHPFLITGSRRRQYGLIPVLNLNLQLLRAGFSF